MNTRKKTQFMTMTALLTAIAILIPIVMPFKNCHSTCFLHFGEPHRYFYRYVLVALDGNFCHPSLKFWIFDGWLSHGYRFRAFSHIFFGTLGALYLQKFPDTLDKPKSSWIFNFVLAVVHALAEVLACIVFYATSGTNVENMFYVLFVLVGFGTIIHSMVDYTLALAVYKVLRKRR